MGTLTNNKTKRSWGRKASVCLFTKWNCAEATMQTCQDLISRKEDTLLKAIAGLEGGIVSSGSTCGVVSGGALGLALMHDEALQKNGIEAEVGLISLVRDYVKWFNDNYGTTLCKERSGVDFWSLGGFVRYILPGDRVLRCLSHISKSMQYLYESRGQDLPRIEVEEVDKQAASIHCAQAVLKSVRANTTIGDPLLERLSVVLDGGVGLQGGACGALAGAIMDINIATGMNLRDATYMEAVKAFFGGHKNLRANKPKETPEPYNVGKEVVRKFREEAGTIECHTITGTDFSDWASFQKYMCSSDKCKKLIELSIDEATRAIQRYT